LSELLSGAEIVGATNEVRSPKTALFRFDGGALPVCCVNSAFFFAIAAAASGNMALIVEESRPELRFAPGDGGGRPKELREVVSILSFDIASLKRLDMASDKEREGVSYML
jgi:hypothetical protein